MPASFRSYLILALLLPGCNSNEKKEPAQTPAETPETPGTPVIIEPLPTPTPTPAPLPPDDDGDDDECKGDDDGYGSYKDGDDDCECPAWAPLKDGRCGAEDDDD